MSFASADAALALDRHGVVQIENLAIGHQVQSIGLRESLLRVEQASLLGVYYTSTVLKLFMRVRVDRGTLAPLGIPEYLGGDKMMGDFCLDEDAGVAYVTTHRENTIDRMSLEPDRDEEREIIAGSPFDEELVGPSSGAWGREVGEMGRVAFFTTDGGTTALPPDGILRPAKILRVELWH